MRNKLTYLMSAVLCLFLILDGSLAVTSSYDVAPSPFRERARTVLYTPTAHDEYCLTHALYYEAGNQSIMGKEAVAWVIINRAGHRGYPKTICGTIAQSRVIEDTKVCQFSYWCERHRKPEKEIWNDSQEVAHRVLQNVGIHAIIDQYGDASYFHADYVRPYWRKSKVFVGKIDNHLFYREP